MKLVDYVYVYVCLKQKVQHLENSYSLKQSVYKVLYITHPMNAERCPGINVMGRFWPHLCSYEYYNIIWANILSALMNIGTITYSSNMVEAVKQCIGSAIA